MSKQQICVTFRPYERSVNVLEGTTILQAAVQAGLTLNTPCGSAGTCGKCQIQITSHTHAPSEADRLNLTITQLEEGWRHERELLFFRFLQRQQSFHSLNRKQ